MDRDTASPEPLVYSFIHLFIYSFMYVCWSTQKEALLHMGENIWSPSMEPHADGRPTYNGVRPGSPGGSSRVKQSKNNAPPSSQYSSWTAWPLMTGPIGCTKTSVNNYKSTLCNISEEGKSVYVTVMLLQRYEWVSIHSPPPPGLVMVFLTISWLANQKYE